MTAPYYSDGSVTIYHGEAVDVLGRLPEASCDVLMTDPPYSSGGMFRGDRARPIDEKYNVTPGARIPSTFGGDNRDQWSWIKWVTGWTFGTLRIIRPNGQSFIFSDWRQVPALTDAIQFGGWTWRGLLVWDKKTTRPALGKFYATLEFIVWGSNGALDVGEETPSALFSVPTVRGDERQHVTQKPVALIRHLLSVLPPSGPLTILDPFMGSGTTLRAAKDLGHKAIGVELDERNCEIAARRMGQEVLPL